MRKEGWNEREFSVSSLFHFFGGGNKKCRVLHCTATAAGTKTQSCSAESRFLSCQATILFDREGRKRGVSYVSSTIGRGWRAGEMVGVFCHFGPLPRILFGNGYLGILPGSGAVVSLCHEEWRCSPVALSTQNRNTASSNLKQQEQLHPHRRVMRALQSSCPSRTRKGTTTTARR